MKLTFAAVAAAILPAGTYARIGSLNSDQIDVISSIGSFERGLETCERKMWRRNRFEWPGYGDECFSIEFDGAENAYSDCPDGPPGTEICCSGYQFWPGRQCKPCVAADPGPNPFGAVVNDLYIPHDCVGGPCDPMNLGDLLGKATNRPEEFPILGQFDPNNPPSGSDNNIAALIRRDYISREAAEIEGSVVICENFVREPNGVNDMNQVGAGSGIGANNDGTVLSVGQDITLEGGANLRVNGKVEFGGIFSNPGGADMIDLGRPSHQPHAYCDDAFWTILQDKSNYWKELYPNGIWEPPLMQWGSKIVLKAGDYECLQVFHIDRNDIGNAFGPVIQFDQSLWNKTIVINVASHNEEVLIANWHDFIDPQGVNSFAFGPKYKKSILWNFYDAKKVVLGKGTGGAQWPGAIVVPHGDLYFKAAGHSGRLVVGGNLIQEATGSELHNYPYDPPCLLPCEGGGTAPEGTPPPTASPTASPTGSPTTPEATSPPTGSPTKSPTGSPTTPPTASPTGSPTTPPTGSPTKSPTGSPTTPPTASPTGSPTTPPTGSPTKSPTGSPTTPPTGSPTASPTGSPTTPPTASPTKSPTGSPTTTPTGSPTKSPTGSPTTPPTASPTKSPTGSPTTPPTASPTGSPTTPPTGSPTKSPTGSPTTPPTGSPTASPTGSPTTPPTGSPTKSPTGSPTTPPTASPTKSPTGSPTTPPTASPTGSPTTPPTGSPTKSPTGSPTTPPTGSPTASPTGSPTTPPTGSPTTPPTGSPTKSPTGSPTTPPTGSPTKSPTGSPTTPPTASPTKSPTGSPTTPPTGSPTGSPTTPPTGSPTKSPTKSPTGSPTTPPTGSPTKSPTQSPTTPPTGSPTRFPTSPPTTDKDPDSNECNWRTQTQGGWGQTCPEEEEKQKNNPGCYLEETFDTCFENSKYGGALIGLFGYSSLTFTTYQNVTHFLSTGGKSNIIPDGCDGDCVDPCPEPKICYDLDGDMDPTDLDSTFLNQLLTTTITVGLDGCIPDFGLSATDITEAKLCVEGSPCRDRTVMEILDLGNQAAAGMLTYPPDGFPLVMSLEDINDCLDDINNACVDGVDSDTGESTCMEGYLECACAPTTEPISSPPTLSPTTPPTGSPTKSPTQSPTAPPTASPTGSPTTPPTGSPTKSPTGSPTTPPTKSPTKSPTGSPTTPPTASPTKSPTQSPTTPEATSPPTGSPTKSPTGSPTTPPTTLPTASPTTPPTTPPTASPTGSPTKSPTQSPTTPPTGSPTKSPTQSPTTPPTASPTKSPTQSPTTPPTGSPTKSPTQSPTTPPTASPTKSPTTPPTASPTKSPTTPPTASPTKSPTQSPTTPPTKSPTIPPTPSPTKFPTSPPTTTDPYPEWWRTQTQGGWGQTCPEDVTKQKNNPGCYLKDNFDACFVPTTYGGALIGTFGTHSLTFTTYQNVTHFLSTGGKSSIINEGCDGDCVDPCPEPKICYDLDGDMDPTDLDSTFLNQLLTTTITVGFDGCYSDFGKSDKNITEAKLCFQNTECNNDSVSTILARANAIAAAETASNEEISAINECLDKINNACVDGVDSDTGLSKCTGILKDSCE